MADHDHHPRRTAPAEAAGPTMYNPVGNAQPALPPSGQIGVPYHPNPDGSYSPSVHQSGSDVVVTGALVNRSGTATAGGTAQQAAAANTGRRYLLIINPTTAAEQGTAAAETLWVDFGSVAVAAPPSIPLEPGDSLVFEGRFVPSDAVSVLAATTGHAFTAKEG